MFIKLTIKTITVLLLIATALPVSSQKREVSSYIKKIAKGETELNQIVSEARDKRLLWDLMTPVCEVVEDTLVPNSRRLLFYNALSRIGILSDDTLLRKKVLYQLAKNNINNNLYSDAFANCALSFQQGDYSDSTKREIVKLALSRQDSWKVSVKVVGYFGSSEHAALLEGRFHNDSLLSARDRWVLHVALARLGSSSHAEYCLFMAQLAGVNSDVVYALYPDLVYTRNRAVIDYLVSLIYSNEKGCLASDPDAEELIPCAYRIIELITPIINNFPLKIGSSGDIETFEYPVALKIARNWFDKNPNYTINTTIY